MNPTSVLEQILQELRSAHGAHTVFLYGSRADDSAGPDSDYDIAAFAPVTETVRIARRDAGTYLDIFVYSEALLSAPSEAMMKLRGSRVLIQRATQGDDFLRGLDDIFREGPAALPANEIAARRVWAHKMLARIQRSDPEGNYRRAWLLQALLEDYFHLRAAWYEGPKKALRWLAQFEPAAYEAFRAALEPGARQETIAALVERVVGPPADQR